MIWAKCKPRAPDYLLNFLFCLHSERESRRSDGSETKLLGLTYTKSGFVPELVAQWDEFSICTTSHKGQKEAWSLLSKRRNPSAMLPPQNGKRGAVAPLFLPLPQGWTGVCQRLGTICCAQGHKSSLVPSTCGHLKGSM